MYAILVVDDNKNFLKMIRDFFGGIYRIQTAESPEIALRLCETGSFDMVISDVRMPRMSGPELLQKIARLHPGIRTILITAYNTNEIIHLARKYRISSILPKTVPFNFNELRTMVDGLLTGEIFGLPRYLQKTGRIIGDFCVTSSLRARRVRDEIVTLFEHECGTSGDMKLLVDEAVTNAIYHAPHNEDGSEKYPEMTEVNLRPHEYVYVQCGCDDEKYGVSVTDTQGRLQRETVLEKIDRHNAGLGILDLSGRGIHMTRLFADTMIINIKPGVRTEVIIINYISKKYKGFKPLYVNEI